MPMVGIICTRCRRTRGSSWTEGMTRFTPWPTSHRLRNGGAISNTTIAEAGYFRDFMARSFARVARPSKDAAVQKAYPPYLGWGRAYFISRCDRQVHV